MKICLVTFFKNGNSWKKVMCVNDVATEIWLNDSLPGIPLEVIEI